MDTNEALKERQGLVSRNIFTVTALIQQDFPELYQWLSETPLFMPAGANVLQTDYFDHYLETIRAQLYTFQQAALSGDTT